VANVARTRVFGIVLAGGEGKRLLPLTADRAKPAVPFGGSYRLIDFVLSNLVNGRVRRIVVLTQYKSHSLDRHISTTWRLSSLIGDYVTPVPAQMRRGPHWFQGSADAVYQSLNLIYDEQPAFVCVFGADHIYRMDPRQMVQQHISTGAGVTVAGIRVPIEQSSHVGVIEPASDGVRIQRFREKPRDPAGLAQDPKHVLASMGNYVFSTKTLIEAVATDAADSGSAHDIGGDIIPMMVESGEAYVYDFAANVVPGVSRRERGYWRDVGSLDAFHATHMDLLTSEPVFDLYNAEWPILTWNEPAPPARFLSRDGETVSRIDDSLISSGVIVDGGSVRRSVLSPGVMVHPGAEVSEAVLMGAVVVGQNAVVRRAIVDKNVTIPEGTKIGVDLDLDRERFVVSPGGIVVIGKGQKVG
jgi:glucose-1-phosphate adenylyltransferase